MARKYWYDKEGRRHVDSPPWKKIRDCHNDPLALRFRILLSEGRQTLHNVIRGAHGLPNYY